jgi:hypothetical protein
LFPACRQAGLFEANVFSLFLHLKYNSLKR